MLLCRDQRIQTQIWTSLVGSGTVHPIPSGRFSTNISNARTEHPAGAHIQEGRSHLSALVGSASLPACCQAPSSFSSAKHSACSQPLRPSWRTPSTAAPSGSDHALSAAAASLTPSAPPCSHMTKPDSAVTTEELVRNNCLLNPDYAVHFPR